ncbi:tyrosine--tRNA ligase [Luteococcus sp. Sow4_B9]|uniref:tyrosine--tRNA ligase n=1 Tax=Luteococcus sp. Sow4_B9 TaxID=3438792 RepID=UPI003F9C9F8C
MNAVLDELKWRGLVYQSTDEAALAEHLDQGPITGYIGFDPSAPSIHFGNLVQLMVWRRLQEAGHKPLLLVGGATGLIGDPRMSSERNLNPKDVVEQWVERIRAQVSRYVSFEGSNAAEVVNNYDWTKNLSTLDFLRDVGKYFSVNRMLARDVVASRLESGISYTEFSYILLQSLDYRELYRTKNCTLQTGASDQWGNISSGVELIRRSDGGKVHGLCTPLLTKADGTKFGKTESGTVWLDPEMTSPYAFHQFFLNAEDAKVIDYLKVFSDRDHDEIDHLEHLTQTEPFRRAAQKALADDITDLVHSVAEREAAVNAAQAAFGRGELSALPPATVQALMKEVGAATVEGTELPTIVDALALAGVVPSKSAARRAVDEGGAYLNNEKITDPERRLTADDLLAGKYVLLRRGKKTVGGLEIIV